MKSWLKYKEALNSEIVECWNERPVEIAGVTNDSRKVKPGWLFVAIKGEVADGHQYIEQAVKNGAAVIVCSESLKPGDDNVTWVQVRNSYYAYSCCCECWFDYPARQLKLIGITGTNGKTSSAFLLKMMLEKMKYRVGLISTVEYVVGEQVIPASRTTPEAFELQRLFRLMTDGGCEYGVMEVSSHALEQCRLANSCFDVAVFTNLTGDHLDYHGTMDHYFAAKCSLFEHHMKDDGCCVINTDDSYGRILAQKLRPENMITFGQEEGCSLRFADLQESIGGSSFLLTTSDEQVQVNTNLIGYHNTSNLTGVCGALLGQKITLERIAEILNQEKLAIPGRLEPYQTADGKFAFIDYAHTDDALEHVLRTLRELAEKRLIVVFGCGGDRDKSKRPRMGRVAAEYADVMVITSDNPRSEDPMAIIHDIEAGIEGGQVVVEPDRRKAISYAFHCAEAQDVILIAGKGHEEYQEIDGEFFDFSDKKEVEKYL